MSVVRMSGRLSVCHTFLSHFPKLCFTGDTCILRNAATIFYLVTLTLKYDLFLKKFNLCCYLVNVAARRASLSSGNSYHSCAKRSCAAHEWLRSWLAGYVSLILNVRYTAIIVNITSFEHSHITCWLETIQTLQ